MKYAKLVKLGGELIEAKDADYQDYYGILTCPECGEPVFLRKGHQRGDTVFRAAFVHHRAIPEVSACEMRVGKYSQEYVARVAGEARNQRLRMLEVSMWKYLKTTKAADFKEWYKADKLTKTRKPFLKNERAAEFFEKFFSFVTTNIEANREKVFDEFDQSVIGLGDHLFYPELYHPLDYEQIEDTEEELALPNFFRSKKKDWAFHSKISREAFELFLMSNFLKDIRYRVAQLISYLEIREEFLWPESTKPTPFADLRLAEFYSGEFSQEKKDWLEKFLVTVSRGMAYVFLAVDWIEVLNVNKEEIKKTRGFAPLAKR